MFFFFCLLFGPFLNGLFKVIKTLVIVGVLIVWHGLAWLDLLWLLICLLRMIKRIATTATTQAIWTGHNFCCFKNPAKTKKKKKTKMKANTMLQVKLMSDMLKGQPFMFWFEFLF